MRFFWENPRSLDSSGSKKTQNPKKDYFPMQGKQTNPELRANFKNKKKIGVKFVLEKFLQENAIRKEKYLSDR